MKFVFFFFLSTYCLVFVFIFFLKSSWQRWWELFSTHLQRTFRTLSNKNKKFTNFHDFSLFLIQNLLYCFLSVYFFLFFFKRSLVFIVYI